VLGPSLLRLQPAADDVDGDPTVIKLTDRRDLVGRQSRVPRTRKDRRDDVDALGRRDQSVTDGDRLVLKLGSVSRREPDLAQRVIESTPFGDAREFDVVVEGPTAALLDLADDQPAADVGNPVGKFNVGRTGADDILLL
jgi:hypothetical protein